MAAPVHTTQARKSHRTVSETAIKKDFLEVEVVCVIIIPYPPTHNKNSFCIGQSKYSNETEFQNRTGCRTSCWRGNRRANARQKSATIRRKINGRPCRPPTKWLLKNRKVLYWYGYTTKSEPILSQIRNFGKTTDGSAPRRRGAGRPRKNFQILFNGRVQIIFSNNEEIFAGLPLRHWAEAEQIRTKSQADKNSLSFQTPSFLSTCSDGGKFFGGGGAKFDFINIGIVTGKVLAENGRTAGFL